ncbi:MAG: hypothetical protein AB7P21_03705 [Lautropia sp.]
MPPHPHTGDDRPLPSTVRLPGPAGYSLRVGADVYQMFASTLRRLLPARAPGLTQAEIRRRMAERLPASVASDAAQSAWLTNMVHRDLVARSELAREQGHPARWVRVRRRAQPTMPICQGTNSLSPRPSRSLAVD